MRAHHFWLFLLLCACQEPSPISHADVPRPEHPRPDLFRPNYLLLNGPWSFRHDPENLGLEAGWSTGTETFPEIIEVPFPFESVASGLGSPFPDDATAVHALTDPTYQGVSWYQRPFLVPSSLRDERVFLVFGAVDWRARVWVNGQEVGSHEGGWLPFSLDITDALAPTLNELVVRVEDLADAEPDILIGKQGGVWYTRSSGIWQSVYLEARPSTWVETLHFTPDWRTGQVQVRLELGGAIPQEPLSLELTITDPSGNQALDTRIIDGHSMQGSWTLDIPSLLGQAELWSPSSPALYTVDAALSQGGSHQDQVSTRFGIRGFEVDWAPGHGPDDAVPVQDQYTLFTLNGEPIYLRGLLDQNYHPEGLLSYPSLEALDQDLLAARDMGFNLLRIHIMHPEPWKLQRCDELGILVMQDIPSPAMYLQNVPGTPAREHWAQDLQDALHRDHNHPSLVYWTLFNEAWGLLEPEPLPESAELQSFVAERVEAARALDPSRLIEDDSTTDVLTGALAHVETDVLSWHFYSRDLEEVRADLRAMAEGSYPGSDLLFVGEGTRTTEPLLVSEFGGASAYLAYHATDAEIGRDFAELVQAVRREPEIGGYVFTQLSDVEWERNGLLTYDRQPKDLQLPGLEGLTDLNGSFFIIIDPSATSKESSSLSFEFSIAQGGDGEALLQESLTLTWEALAIMGPGGTSQRELASGALTVQGSYGLTQAGTAIFEAPELSSQEQLLLLAVLRDSSGARVAANLWREPSSTR